MVKVRSSRRRSKTKFVNVEIKGIDETLRILKQNNTKIDKGADFGAIRAANFVQQEVQESIIGRRAEPKSVDTGRFGNSISVKKIGKAVAKVFPRKISYPGTTTTTEEVAKKLEFGFSTMPGRRHFRNTEKRTRAKVKKIINDEVTK